MVPLSEPVLQMLREVWKMHRSPKWLLPKGFHKARYYGLRHYSKRLLQQRARLLLSLESRAKVEVPMTVADVGSEAQRAADDRYIGSESSADGFRTRCPHCGSDRVVHLEEVPRGRSP